MLWIGGPPASGKTTIANRLARRHGLRWYNSDTRTWAHRDRALDEGNEAAHRWEALPPAERWSAPPDELLAMQLHTERGRMVADDVRALPESPLVIAQGSVVSPALVDPSRALWLLPTPELARARLDERQLQPGPRALYEALAETIERDAREHGVPTLTVDGTRGIDETVAAVEEHFAHALAEGPLAESAAERRELLREANLAHVEQVRGYCARPWAEGDAESVERTFVCECGDCACDAEVVTTVGAAAATPVRAPAHA